jgi:hypothetical protein
MDCQIVHRPHRSYHRARSHVGSPERVIVDRFASVSFSAALDAPARERVLDQVSAFIAAAQVIAGRDTVTLPYITRLYWCRAR